MLRQPTIKPTHEEEEGGDAGDDDEDDDEGSDAEPLASGAAGDDDDDSEPETPRRAANKGKGIASPTSGGGLLQGVMGKSRGKGRAMSTTKSPLAISTVREEDGTSRSRAHEAMTDLSLQIRLARQNLQHRRPPRPVLRPPRPRSSRRASRSGHYRHLHSGLKAPGPNLEPRHPYRHPWLARTAPRTQTHPERRRPRRKRRITSVLSLPRLAILPLTPLCDLLRRVQWVQPSRGRRLLRDPA